MAKLVRAALALKNQNGGYFVIGFDDKTRKPTNPVPSLVGITSRFNQDTIQGIISKYASTDLNAELNRRPRTVFCFPSNPYVNFVGIIRIRQSHTG